MCLPDVRVALGLIAPRDKALAKFKISFVFIALASVLPYCWPMIYLFELLFSQSCASSRLLWRGCNFNGL